MNDLLKYFLKNKVRENNSIAEKEKFEVGFLVFWVGTKCSLRCRDCGNLIPYSTQISFNMDQIISDLKTLLRFCKIGKMQIQGGEPFTHPEIGKLIQAIDGLNIQEVVISTNGTIKLNPHIIKLLKNVRNPKFQMVISSYNCVNDRQNDFYNTLVANEINCFMYNFFKNDGSWVNQGGIETCRNNDEQKVQELYTACEFKVCLSLVDGQLFRCGRARVSSEVFNIKYTSNDYLDIRKITDTVYGLSEIMKFYNNPQFKEYCRYCLGTDEKIPAGIQL